MRPVAAAGEDHPPSASEVARRSVGPSPSSTPSWRSNGLLDQMGSFRDIGAALGRAERSRVLIALRCSMLTFPASAVGVRAGLGPPLPLGPITSLQLSSMFAKLVTPTGLGSTAMDVRVMQRRGVDRRRSPRTLRSASSAASPSCFRRRTPTSCAGAVPGRRAAAGSPSSSSSWGLVVAVISRVPKLRLAVVPHVRRASSTSVRLAKSPRNTLLTAVSAVGVSALFALASGCACGPTAASCGSPRSFSSAGARPRWAAWRR